MSTPLERDIERSLGRMIGGLGGYCMKWVCPGWAGVPDRICLLPGGRIIFVELKRPEGGKVSELQKAWGKRLQLLGFDFRIIRTHEQIKALREELERIYSDEKNTP